MNRSKLEKGSALAIMLILAVGVGSVVTTFLGRTLVEQTRVAKRVAQVRAFRMAQGQLEIAKSLIANSAYNNGTNQVVAQALAANPPVIPGTGVYVEAAGPALWYRLTSFGDFNQQTGTAVEFFRDGTPYVSYNYYVESMPLGVSGKPRGKIHTNEGLEFYFANGVYDDFVSAGSGFTYKNGAAVANTMLAGGSDPAAGQKDLLHLIDYSNLQSSAVVVTPPNQTAKITLNGKNLTIDLWSKASTVQVPVTVNKKVQTGTTMQLVTVPTFNKVWQWVPVQVTTKVWVPAPAAAAAPANTSATGTDVVTASSPAAPAGSWKTTTSTVQQWKQVNVASGTTDVWKSVPVFTTQTTTVMQNQVVPGTLQSSKTYPANGIFYISDQITNLSGTLNGQVTLVADQQVKITGSIQYVDNAGQTAFLNGLDPTKNYVPNPSFTRNQVLGIISKSDIIYSNTVASQLEINASLISTGGTVGYQGISIALDGTLTLTGAATTKASLRRFGSIMADKRPVSTLVDASGNVTAGFQTGSSQYDRNLLTLPPPGYPSEQIVMFQPTLDAGGAAFTDAGAGVIASATWAPIGQLSSLQSLRRLVKQFEFQWDRNVGP